MEPGCRRFRPCWWPSSSFGPGLLWGAVLGLRRLSLVALAGPFGVTAIVLAAELGR